MEHYELQVLGDWLHTGAQAANTWWTPTPQAGLAELEAHEVAEVVFIEVFPPVTGAGVDELLRKIILILDGKSYHPYVSVSGIRASLMTPPKVNIMGRELLALGVPMVNAVRNAAPMLAGTCPKYRDTVTIEALAGGAITQDYRVRLWGYRYEAEDLPRVVGRTGGPFEVRDVQRNRILTVDYPVIDVTEDTWAQLPGGMDQKVPKINPLLRYAYNLLATTPNTPYQFRYETGAVTDRDENLYFPYDVEDRHLIVKGIGVRAPANLARAYMDIDGYPHPKSAGRAAPGFPTTQFNNPLHFGHAFPMFAVDLPLYFAVPKLDIPLLISKEKGFLAVQDNGAAVVLNTCVVALSGTLIEMV
jgi:hypothetical protein